MIATLRRVLPGATIALLAAGCGSNVRMDPPTIPEPLIDTIPMSIALRMPENFEHFVHEEEVLGNEHWTIDLGRSNAAFFSQLFGYIFEDVAVLGAEDDTDLAAFDAVIEASIDAFEFSVPNQTKTDSFAVWIRYRIKVYDRKGTMVANWPVSAYGKSLTTLMGGSDALERAAVLAMRDAAALLIMKFDEQTLISSLADPPVTKAAGDEQREATAQATISPGGGNE